MPLFESFDIYKKSLPVRCSIGEELPLYTLPYWVNEDEITSLADRLLLDTTTSRSVVKYLAAPGGFGKTSAILPAFLKSTERDGGFTHYVYLPFDNNNHKYYKLHPDSNSELNVEFAEEQGASFVCKCVQHLLIESPSNVVYPYYFPCDATPPSWVTIKANMRSFLNDTFGPEYKVLFHLDEHRKMCGRNFEGNDDMVPGALFSRGAMLALADMSGVTVIATYTKRPTLPPLGSSMVCRYPVSLPSLDIHAAIECIPELQFPQEKLDSVDRRLLATLHFRLGMVLQYKYGITQLHRRNREIRERLLVPFEKSKQHSDAKKAFKDCAEVCKFKIVHRAEIPNKYAAHLLVGIADTNIGTIEQQVNNVVVVGEKISCSLLELLEMNDPNVTVYNSGQDRFVQMLSSTDFLADAPLEAAYSWTLSCKSALSGCLVFNDRRYSITCNKLLPGRLFPTTSYNTTENSFSDLQYDVLYYADERFGKSTHPLCDIFFRSRENDIVLVDITGSSKKDKVARKRKKLVKWIEQEQDKVKDFELHGMVLAPLCTGKSTRYGQVQIMCDEAQSLLCGLVQVLRWFT